MGPDDYVKEVMTTMKRFREQSILCDTVLVTDDQEIPAHSVVLAAVSPFLCSTFRNLGGSKATRIRYNVSLPGCSASAVELVLQFLYSGQLTMPSVYQQADEFSRIIFVCKSLGIDVGKLNGARVTFDSSLERTAVAESMEQWVEACGIPLEDFSSNCDGQLHKVEDSLDECESGVSSFPSSNNISINDLPSAREDTALDSSKMSLDTPMPLSSGMVAEVSKKRMIHSSKGAVKNTSGQIFSRRSATRLAARRNGNKEKPAKIATTKQPLTEVILYAVRNEKKKDMPLTNNNASVLRDVNGEDYTDVKQSSPVVDMPKSDSDDILKSSAEVREKLNVEKLTVGRKTVRKHSVEVCDKRNTETLTVSKDRAKERKMYSCLSCDKVFLRPSCFRKHVQSHGCCGKSLVCDKCGKVFTSPSLLKGHQKAHIEGYPHVCEVCGKGYKFKRYLLVHAITHTGIKPFLCDTCGRGFCVITNLRRHVLMRHTTIRPHVCGICGKGFITRQRLRRHEESHFGERTFNCETCGSSFRNAGNLGRHRMLHTGEKPYVCPICLRAFTQKVTMQSHMTTHADQKTFFVCQICGKSLRSKVSNLKKHMQMHSQQKPHVCEVCGKSFAVKEYLSRHAVIHSEKMYVCETCKKGYRSERSLLEHSKTHNAIPCDKCGKEFAGPRALNTHVRVHLQDDNFVCKVCGKGFGLRAQLDAHSKLHLR